MVQPLVGAVVHLHPSSARRHDAPCPPLRLVDPGIVSRQAAQLGQYRGGRSQARKVDRQEVSLIFVSEVPGR